MGVIPYSAVLEAMRKCDVTTKRYRKLPIELMVYYVICMTLYAEVSLQEVLRCIFEGCNKLKLTLSCGIIDGRGGISNARNRLGSCARTVRNSMRADRRITNHRRVLPKMALDGN